MTNYPELRQTIQEKMAGLKEELRALGETYFKEESARIFEEFPNLKSFSWKQYTPYFNDGDECVFGVGSDYPEALMFDGEEFEELYFREYHFVRNESGGWDKGPKKEPTTEKDKLAVLIPGLLQAVDDDVMKALFGDHCQVIVSRDGIEVEEYYHD